MDTDHLIRTLTSDHPTRERPAGMTLAVALAVAAPISLAMFLAMLGVRPDVRSAMRDPFFDIKFVVTLSLVAVSLVVALRLARPGARLNEAAWLLMVPVALLTLGILGDLMMPHQSAWTARLVGKNMMTCMVAIPLLALPLLAAALYGLRQGAAMRPAAAGASAGLLSGGLAATIYAAHCTDDSPLFVATWYSLAIGAVAGLGALAGQRILRV